MDAPPAFRRQLLDVIPRLRRYARTLTFDTAAADDEAETGSLSGSLAGLSSGAEDDAADETGEAGVTADVGLAAGSLG